MLPVPQPVKLIRYRGAIVLCGAGLEHVVRRLSPDTPAPTEHILHITLLLPQEVKRLSHARRNARLPPLDPAELGVRSDQIYVFASPPPTAGPIAVRRLPVLWHHADAWRKQLGLGSKAYHVTLTNQSQDPSLGRFVWESIRASGSLDREIDQAAQLGEGVIDHLALALYPIPAEGRCVAAHMILRYPDSARGYIRLGDVAAFSFDFKLASLAYAQAATRDPSLLDLAAQKLCKFSSEATFGPLVTKEEHDQISSSLRPYLLRAWDQDLVTALSSTLWTAPVSSRARQLYYHPDAPGSPLELPRFFSWVYPGWVAGMSTPRSAMDLDMLIDLGFTHILTLTEEQPLNTHWFTPRPLENVYVPLPNYGAPTLAEMDAILARIRAGGVWLVHCGGGVGRAGTVLACLISMLGRHPVQQIQGIPHGDGDGDANANPNPNPNADGDGDHDIPQLDARSAITLLRQMRPRSLESGEQERFVSSFVSHRWKAAYKGAPLAEPVNHLFISPALSSVGKPGLHTQAAVPTVLFMIGKPASGKSWLAQAITKRRPKGKTLVISQDESGREACERQIGRAQADDTWVILDRCNPSRQERATWRSFLPEGRRCIAVYFDYEGALCLQRQRQRLGHPTLRAGRGGGAISQMEQKLDRPDADAERFDYLFVIASFAAATEALETLTSTPALIKFPRTPHLLDLGACADDDLLSEEGKALGRGRGSSDASEFGALSGQLTVEEKIDGANMGISLDLHGAIQVQNRSHWICSETAAQFRPLATWLDRHGAALTRILDRDPVCKERFILYGEWVVAQHSVHYTALPDHFLAFDMWDRWENVFLSRSVLETWLRGTGIPLVPLLAKTDRVTRAQLLDWVQQPSAFSPAQRREGVYVRFEDADRLRTVRRGKIVRSDFVAGNERWDRGPLTLNTVAHAG